MTVQTRISYGAPLPWSVVDENFTSLQNGVDAAAVASDLASTEVGKGAAYIGISPIDGLTSTDVQAAIAEIANGNNALDGVDGAGLVGANDGESGALWTTVQGFINKIRSSLGSALVGFVQSGAGAVARTVQDKAREIVSVMDFGAVGDGLTDDTSAIQAAIDAVASGSVRGAVFFPRGNYKTSAPIIMSPHVQIRGEGRGVVRFLNKFPGGTFALANNVWIEDILIETTANETDYAFVGADTSYINMRHVDVLGGSFSGTRSKVMKITGNTWHTLMATDCVWDIGSQIGDAVMLQGNASAPQNADVHFDGVFLDTLLSTSATCGGLHIKDLYGVHFRGGILRTSESGYNLQLTRTSTGTVDAVVEHSSLDYATTSGKGLIVNSGCAAYLKNTTVDSIYAIGRVVVFDSDATYTIPGRTTFSWVNQGASSVQFTSKGEHTLIQPSRGAPPNGPSIALQLKSKIGSTYTLDACISPGTMAKSFHRCGLAWRESSTGNLVLFQVLSGNTLAVTKYTNPSTFSADYLTTGFTPGNKVWMRITEDTTNRNCWISSDGQYYVLIHQVAKADFCKPDQVGWFIDAECQVAPNLGAMATLKSFNEY